MTRFILQDYMQWPSWHFSVSFIVFAVFFPLLALVSKGIYNRYFHPLSRFPGPFWGSVTDFYLAYVISSVPTLGLELHQKYGECTRPILHFLNHKANAFPGRIIRIAPNLLSFSDPNLLPVVYHRWANKTPWYSNWLFENACPMFQTLSYKEHAARQKLVAPCVGMHSLSRFLLANRRAFPSFIVFHETFEKIWREDWYADIWILSTD